MASVPLRRVDIGQSGQGAQVLQMMTPRPSGASSSTRVWSLTTRLRLKIGDATCAGRRFRQLAIKVIDKYYFLAQSGGDDSTGFLHVPGRCFGRFAVSICACCPSPNDDVVAAARLQAPMLPLVATLR